METPKVTKTLEKPLSDKLEIERQGALLQQQCTSETASADPERSVGAILLREFEMAHGLAENRRVIRTNSDGSSVEEFVFRDQSGMRAEECMRVELDRSGKIISAMCQTDFGFPDDPQYLVGARHDGSYCCAVQHHHNDSDSGVMSLEWQELDGEAARQVLTRFAAVTTKSLEAVIERSDDEQHHANETARRLTLNMQRYGGSVIEASFLAQKLV